MRVGQDVALRHHRRPLWRDGPALIAGASAALVFFAIRLAFRENTEVSSEPCAVFGWPPLGDDCRRSPEGDLRVENPTGWLVYLTAAAAAVIAIWLVRALKETVQPPSDAGSRPQAATVVVHGALASAALALAVIADTYEPKATLGFVLVAAAVTLAAVGLHAAWRLFQVLPPGRSGHRTLGVIGVLVCLLTALPAMGILILAVLATS